MKKLLFAVCVVFFALSCTRDEGVFLDRVPKSKASSLLVVGRDMPEAVVGDKLPNPYTTAIMRQAYFNLAPATRGNVYETDIATSHLYVRFNPGCDTELNRLLLSNELVLFTTPLDRKLSTGWIKDDPEFMMVNFLELFSVRLITITIVRMWIHAVLP